MPGTGSTVVSIARPKEETNCHKKCLDAWQAAVEALGQQYANGEIDIFSFKSGVDAANEALKTCASECE